MNREDRTKKLLHEILDEYAHRWFARDGEAYEKFIEELAEKYDVHLKRNKDE